MSIRELIIKAHEKNLLRYPPENLLERLSQGTLVSLDLRRTFGSGVEFGYLVYEDCITDAFQTIDGTQLDVNDFITELAEAVGEDPLDYIINTEEQPCQHYKPKENRWIVLEETSVDAVSEEQAIERVVTWDNKEGHQEVMTQVASPVLDETEEWPVHVVVLQLARRPDTDDPINWDWSELEDVLEPLARDVEFVTGGVIGTREYKGGAQ